MSDVPLRTIVRLGAVLGLGALLAACGAAPTGAATPPRSGAVSRLSSSGTAVVNPAQRLQAFEGWGTSLAWWANVLGGWSDGNRSAVADLVFKLDTGNPSTGLGLNIVRYNIGAGPNPHAMRPGGLVPSFEPAPGQWDWSADANQRWMLAAAKNRGVNLFEAFANSPPAWMTNSGCTSGAVNAGDDNLKDDQYDAFADYLVSIVRRFRDDPALAGGLTFRTLSPFNEPNASYWYCGNRQEGAHFSTSAQNRLVKLVGGRLASQGLGTTIGAPEETNLDWTTGTFNAYDSEAKGYVGQINTHTYDGSDRAAFRTMVVASGKRAWMSEFANGEGDHDHATMTAALRLGRQIRNDVAEMNVSAWVYWQAVEDELEDVHNWGLIHANYSGAEQYFLTRNYYVMGQYSKFIRPGARIIASGDADTLAALNAAGDRLVLVVTNDNAGSISKTFDLSGFSSVSGTVQAYRTSPTETLAQVSAPTLSGRSFTANLPAQSVTTLVVSGVSTGGNLLRNPSFDDDGAAGPTASGWSNNVPGAFYTETQDGAHSGSLHGTHYAEQPYAVYTYQQLTNLPNGTYTASAYVRSSGGQTYAYLEAKDYGGGALKANIPATTSWTKVTIPDVQVSNGQATIGLYSESPARKWIHFDDVEFVRQSLSGLRNPSFDDDGRAGPTASGWTNYGPHQDAFYTETQDGAHSGTFHGTHYKEVPYDVYTAQLVTGLANGTYTVSAYVRSSGGQSLAHLEAKDYGGSALTAPIPATTTWTKVSIPNVPVSNGQVTVGLYSNSPARKWIHFDDVELVRQ